MDELLYVDPEWFGSMPEGADVDWLPLMTADECGMHRPKLMFDQATGDVVVSEPTSDRTSCDLPLSSSCVICRALSMHGRPDEPCPYCGGHLHGAR